MDSQREREQGILFRPLITLMYMVLAHVYDITFPVCIQ